MNLVIVGPAFPLRGGIAHHVYHLSQALRDRGHSTQVISYRRLYPKFIFPGKTMRDTSTVALDADAWEILDSIDPATWVRALRTIQTLEPALVVFEWWTPVLAPVIGTLARLLTRSGFKCVFECHNIFPHEGTFLDLPLVQYGLGAAEAFISFSRITRQTLRELFPDKESFYTPLPAPFTHIGAARRAGTTILFFGIVRPYKGLDVLLRALPIVLSRVQCRLIISGEFYEPVEKYLGLINELGLQSYVEVSDRYIPNEEIASFFDQADVLALPYRHATQSGVLRMALATGLPVVASEVGAFGDEVSNNVNGLLVKPDDPESLAAALIRYFTDGLGPKLARNLNSSNRLRDAEELARIVESLAAPSRH